MDGPYMVTIYPGGKTFEDFYTPSRRSCIAMNFFKKEVFEHFKLPYIEKFLFPGHNSVAWTLLDKHMDKVIEQVDISSWEKTHKEKFMLLRNSPVMGYDTIVISLDIL